jgi:hypothetical protein
MLEYWVNGKIRPDDKGENGLYPLETHYSIVPLFHYSMIEAKIDALKNTLYFHSFVEIPRRLINKRFRAL